MSGGMAGATDGRPSLEAFHQGHGGSGSGSNANRHGLSTLAAATAHAKEHQPSLSRNQACRTCRARKVRCNAEKPACGACRKTASVQGRDPDSVVCEYDGEEPSSANGTPGNATASSANNSRKRKLTTGTGSSSSNNNNKRSLSPANSADDRPGSRANNKRSTSSSVAGGSGTSGRKVADLEKTIAELESKLSRGGVQLPRSSDFGLGRPDEPQTASLTSAGLDWATSSGGGGPSFAVGPLSSLFSTGTAQSVISGPQTGLFPPDPVSISAAFTTIPGNTSSAVAGNVFNPGFTTYGSETTPLGPARPGGTSQIVIPDSGIFGSSHRLPFANDFRSAALPEPQEYRLPETPLNAASTSNGGNSAKATQPVSTSEAGSAPATARSFATSVESAVGTGLNSAGAAGSVNKNNVSPATSRPAASAAGPAQGQGSSPQKQGSSTLSDGQFFDLFWPNWPTSLPDPKIVYNLCDVFFSKRFLGEDLVNKAKFFSNLALPPTHNDFPHTSLIHAMCAVATKFVIEDSKGVDDETYWKSEGSPTDYHAAQAKLHIDSAIIKGEKLFSVAQAIILICFYSYTSARFVEVWLYCGLATRICSPLGLNHLESLLEELPSLMFGITSEEAYFRKRDQAVGSAPRTEEEKQEQAHTFWMAFTCDRLAAACTGWAFSLAEEEISTLLPKPQITPGPVQPITSEELEQLSLSSPTFFTSNSLPLVGAANLHYKSVVLLGRVCAFLRSAPWPIGADIIRGARSVKSGLGTRSIEEIPNTPDFKRLDALIVAFRLSFPKDYKNVLRKDHNGSVETNLISAHVIPHASTILLHESFCKTEDDLSMQRCLTSARAILSIIYLLWGSSYDISLLQPFITFCWAVAGRTLVRQLAFRQEAEDELGVATLTQEISVILAAMTAFADKSPLGQVVANSLRALLQDPQSCHPRRNGGMALAKACCAFINNQNANKASANGAMSVGTAQGSNGGPFADSSTNLPPIPAAAGSVESSTSSSSSSNPSSGTRSAGSVFDTPLAAADSVQSSGTSSSIQAEPTPPGQSFSSLLWELEQPGADVGQNANYRKMELDLRSVLGASYDDLLGMS